MSTPYKEVIQDAKTAGTQTVVASEANRKPLGRKAETGYRSDG